jgi:hypothetical protein
MSDHPQEDWLKRMQTIRKIFSHDPVISAAISFAIAAELTDLRVHEDGRLRADAGSIDLLDQTLSALNQAIVEDRKQVHDT